MVRIIAVVIIAAFFIAYLLFMHGASTGRSEKYQQELEDIQMRCVSRKKHN